MIKKCENKNMAGKLNATAEENMSEYLYCSVK